MPVFRCTMFLGQSSTGWSETWWKEAANLPTVARSLEPMAVKRASILTDIHEFDGFRVSEEGKQRISKLFLAGQNRVDGSSQPWITLPAKGTYPVAPSRLQYDQVRACLHIDLSNVGRKFALRYLAGIPDEVTKTENTTIDFINPVPWWAAYKAWHEYMSINGWSVKCLNKTDANPERQIVRWVLQGAAPSLLGLVMPTAASFTPDVGSTVMVRGVKMRADGQRSPNGAWVVDSVVSDVELGTVTVYLRNATGFDPTQFKILGFARKKLSVYLVPDVFEPLRAGIHKRGKRFGAPRGRVKRPRYAS